MKTFRANLVLPVLCLLVEIGSGSTASAFAVTDYGVTIDRYQIGAQELQCFCSDLWGTDIASVTVTTPDNDTYPLSFSTQEQQWSYDQIGSPGVIASSFPDGIYQFDVIYTDDTEEQVFADLVRAFPPFPVVSAFRTDRIGWEPWNGSPSGVAVEVVVESPAGDSFSCEVPTGATHCVLPAGFIEADLAYTIDILFLSSSGDAGFSNSGRIRTCLSTDTDHDGIFDDGDCSGVSGDDVCAGGVNSGCDDNCLKVQNFGQEEVVSQPIDFGLGFGGFAPPGGTVVKRVEAQTGQSLEIIYQKSDNGDFFDFVYYAPGGNPQGQVGLCHFHHGWNEAFLWGPPVTGLFGKLDHITRARWVNIDGGLDDNADGKLEAYDHVYDACNNKYSRRHISCNYPTECMIESVGAISDPDRNWRVPLANCDFLLAETNPTCTIAEIDPPLGPETAVLFQQLLAQLAAFPRTETAMAGWPFDACDLDIDGDCDNDDAQIVVSQLSTCAADPGFNIFADADGSGCIEPIDQTTLFVQDLDGDGSADLDDNCRFDPNASQIDTDADGHGDVCDCAPLDASVFPGARERNDGLDNSCTGDPGFALVDEISFAIGFGGLGSPHELAWVPQEGASTYEVFRASDPSFSACSVTSTSDAFWIDPASPPSAGAFFYVVRASAPNPGSPGRSSTGERVIACP